VTRGQAEQRDAWTVLDIPVGAAKQGQASGLGALRELADEKLARFGGKNPEWGLT